MVPHNARRHLAPLYIAFRVELFAQCEVRLSAALLAPLDTPHCPKHALARVWALAGDVGV
jgi:hypothetical protein